MLLDEGDLQRLVAARIANGRPTGGRPPRLAEWGGSTEVDGTVAAELARELAEINRRWRVHGNLSVASDRRLLRKSLKRTIRKAISWYVDALARMQSDYNASATRVLNAVTTTVRSIQKGLSTEVATRSEEVATLTARLDELNTEMEACRARIVRLEHLLQDGVQRRQGS